MPFTEIQCGFFLLANKPFKSVKYATGPHRFIVEQEGTIHERSLFQRHKYRDGWVQTV